MNIFALILSLSKKLTVLNFCDMFPTRKCQIPIFYLRSESNMSSTLIKLTINVQSFADCLYLLDGRFDSLSTLIVNVNDIYDLMIDIGGRVSTISLIIFREKTVNQINLFSL